MLKPRQKFRRRYKNNFRILKEFDNHEMVIGLSDSKSKLKGYIAIHNTNLGPALGGTRLQHYPSEEAALRDVLNLSKAMSYKCAIAGLPWGGGKAVIFADDTANREAVLAAYAGMVEKLNGLFKTGTDMGVFDDDVRKMSHYTKHMLGVSNGNRGNLTTSKMAALGVYYCIKTSLKQAFKDDSVKNRRVGIKGIGKLGGELLRLLYEEGAEIVIADTDEEKCRAALKKYPKVSVVKTSEIHLQPLDVYSPCALGKEIAPSIIKDLNAKIIAGGANNQLLDDETGDRLFEAGVLYAPDYVTNAGGLIYVADELEKNGFQKKRVLKRIENIEKTLAEIFQTSNRQKIGTHRVSNELAFERIRDGKK